MKKDHEQIIQFLSSFPVKEVVDGLNLWSLMAFENSFDEESVKNLMWSIGWTYSKTKPEKREFLKVFDLYFVQPKEVHRKRVNEEMLKKEERRSHERGLISEKSAKNKKENEKQKAMMGGIKKTEMKCPTCNHTMYKEPICPSCKEGKSGYKIRLMCENNPDHEVLL